MTRQRAGLALLAICAIFVFTACYSAPIMPPPGMLYSEISAPADVDATGAELGSKVGRATSESYFGLVAMGDCSIEAAAANGGIERIDHVDYEFYNLLGLQRFTTVVIGE